MWKYLSARSCENKTRHDRAARGREAWGSWGSQLCRYVIRIFQIVPQCAVSITSNTHFLPHLVPMSPGSWSFNLFSVFAPDGAAGDREAVSGYWVRIYVMVLKAEEGCSWTGQLLHLHAVAGIKWPHGLEMGPWMHDLISRRQRPTNTGHNVGASGGRQETKRKK